MKTTFFTAKQAAEFLGVSMQGLYGFAHKKLIPYYKPNGKNIYFKVTDLENWIESTRIPSASEIEQEAKKHLSKKQK